MRLVGIVTSVALASVARAQSNVTCQDGLYVVVVRASYESPGFGILEPVKDEILSRVPNSAAFAVPYPATIFDPGYLQSESQGVGNLTLVLTQYGDACPGHNTALLGYSQGAQVIGDTLIGTNYPPSLPKSPNPLNTSAIDAKYRDTVVAIILMGDPTKTLGEPFLIGNSTRNGSFPRANDANWVTEGLANRVQSYCTAEDTFCDIGALNNSLAIHLSYISQYGGDAADFVVSRASGNSTSGNGTSTTTTSSPSATGTGTGTGSSTGITTGTTTTTRNPSTTTTSAGGAATSSTPPNSAFSFHHDLTYYMVAGTMQCILAFALVY